MHHACTRCESDNTRSVGAPEHIYRAVKQKGKVREQFTLYSYACLDCWKKFTIAVKGWRNE